jgi:hypothetical protein
MANATVSRIGQIDLAGSATALFLKVFAGEVLTAFAESNVFIGRHVIRSISSGKSAQFPASWKGTASYHTPGTELVGSTVAHNERVITIDDLLVADRFLASIDDAMSHYDVRSEYSRDVGRALAKKFDQNVAQVGLLAARASATVTGGNGGTAITSATSLTNADALVAAAFDAAQALDEKDVPDEDRFLFLKPDQYYLLVNSGSKAIHRDYNPAGNGSLADGSIFKLAGMNIVKTNNLPQSNVVTGPSAYQGDFSTVSALAMQRGAVGTVKLMDLATEISWDPRRRGWLIIAEYAIGHGILRPECAVEVKTA